MDKKETKLSADERQNFVATRMSLPLFMLSRMYPITSVFSSSINYTCFEVIVYVRITWIASRSNSSWPAVTTIPTANKVSIALKHIYKICWAFSTENRREEFSAATYAHYRHVTGFEKTPATPYPEKRPLSYDRAMTTWRGYQQAPNRYGVLPVPFLSRMGSKGTAFAKMHTNKSRVSIKPPPSHFYELPAEIERFFKPENKQKGIFLTSK